MKNYNYSENDYSSYIRKGKRKRFESKSNPRREFVASSDNFNETRKSKKGYSKWKRK